MDKVVYFLGAGFSAPLGLPVMSNFQTMSREMRGEQPDRYKYFDEILEGFKKMSPAKNYFNADLFNIEEILSIMEMNEQLGMRTMRQAVSQYIIDVVQYYTPSVQPYGNDWPGNWYNVLFGIDSHQTNYGYFVGNLLNLRFKAKEVTKDGRNLLEIQGEKVPNLEDSYSVITLNYDLVIESYIKVLNDRFGTNIGIKSGHDHTEAEEAVSTSTFCIAKLHGSVDTKIVVAPTWNKTVDERVRSAWRLAYRLLAQANHIRIIGYSLPLADAYVKYLLKAASLESDNLRHIDVLCRDSTGDVQARYDAFFSKEFQGYRFLNGEVGKYLESNYQSHNQREIARLTNQREVLLDTLEKAHKSFFS